MDQMKTGAMIRQLRKERGLTQQALADRLGISDKAVSKWENGRGAPDISLLPLLAELLGADPAALLRGETGEREASRGDLRRVRFYVCPGCGELTAATGGTVPVCCGRTLTALTPQTPPPDETLTLRRSEDAWYITGTHEMRREHHVAYLAFLTGDTLLVKRLYPEWGLEARLPYVPRGTLLWYCTRHGLFSKEI